MRLKGAHHTVGRAAGQPTVLLGESGWWRQLVRDRLLLSLGRSEGISNEEFFQLYCAKGLSLDQIVKKTGCSKGTASHWKRRCEDMLKTPLETFRQHGAVIDHLERQRREANTRYINGRALIEDDAGFDDR